MLGPLIGAVTLLSICASAQQPPDPAKLYVRGRAHWAFQPVRPKLPSRSLGQPLNPIDRFINQRLRASGLQPAPLADRSTLIRRITLDLTGLPPTPVQVRQFLEDKRPDAYNELVEGLLQSPSYGERWARRWLDVARYAETNGYERDGTKPNAWRYRDYVIDSLNADKPFNRFILEQIAGDELTGVNAETMIATTFLRLGLWDDEPADELPDRYEQLDDVLGTTTAAFLGITLKCARCHDHKFEPLSQRDYYRMLAVFEPLKRPQVERAERDRIAGTLAEVAAYQAKQEKFNKQWDPVFKEYHAKLVALVDRAVAANAHVIPERALEALRTTPEKRTFDQQNQVDWNHEAIQKAASGVGKADELATLNRLKIQLDALDLQRPVSPPRAYVWEEEPAPARPTHIFRRGDPRLAADAVSPGTPSILRGAALISKATVNTTGRRLALANWIASPANPLTARVIVNRVWQGHFQYGLVRSANDFGLMGAPPTHPELLDWLAGWFVKNGWSLKKLHRLIVTSETYRRSASAGSAAQRLDPGNALLSHFPAHRLEAEAVRDSILLVSGQLNPKRGGQSVYPDLPRAVLEGQSRPGDGWGKSSPEESNRRSIYLFSKRSLAVPELEVLDSPDTTCSVEQRPVSTIAPQALTFLNGDFINRAAEGLCQRLAREAGSEPVRQVALAFQLCLARPPNPAELKQGAAFVQTRSLTSFCLVMLNLNEFVYVK